MILYCKQFNPLKAVSLGVLSPASLALLAAVLVWATVFVPERASAQGVELAPGDIIVADFDGFGGLPIPGNIFRIDPELGDFDMISQEGSLTDPFGVAVESDGNIVVAEFGGPGSIVRINPSTGNQSVLTSGGNLNNPVRLDIDPNGDIIVVDNSTSTNHVVKVDHITGEQTVIANGFNLPTGVAVDDDGDIFVTDGGARSVIQIDPETGNKTVVAIGDPFVSPSDVAIEPSGFLIVADFQFLGGNDQGLFRVNPFTGEKLLLSSIDNFDNPSGVAIDANGDILVADLGASLGGNSDGAVIRIDPVTGDPIEVYQGDGLVNPNDVAIFLTQVKPVVPETILLDTEFDIRIDATNALDLTGAQFDLEYDSSLLSVVGTAFEDQPNNRCFSASNDVPGTLSMAMVCESGRSDTTTIWNVTFEVDGTFSTAETEFRLTNVFLNDSSIFPEPIPSRGVRARSNVFVGECGNLNNDDIVTVADVVKAIRFVLAPETATDEEKFLIDTTRDGQLSSGDAAGILKGIVGAVSRIRCGPLLP